jgi:hypothetical protein
MYEAIGYHSNYNKAILVIGLRVINFFNRKIIIENIFC